MTGLFLMRDSPHLGSKPVSLGPLTFTFAAHDLAINDLPREEYPYAREAPVTKKDKGIHDKHGVRMRTFDGKMYNHPVSQASYAIDLLESYQITKDKWYLDLAERNAQRLMTEAVKVDEAWYVPYPFDFALHGKKTDMMIAPWYSAMAQGQALTTFVRLYEATGDTQYKNAADGIFASFLRLRNTKSPWVVWVDDENHLWLEEYASEVPDRTLNGHMFATFGLWDYWRLTKDERAVKLYQGALTMVKDYFPRFRNENSLSHYCLEHPDAFSTKYHQIHIKQLYTMYGFTHDPEFAHMADQLASDFPPPAVDNKAEVKAGTYTAVQFGKDGATTGSRKVVLAADSLQPVDRRERIQGQTGLWYRFTEGDLAEWWIQEKVGTVTLQGQAADYPFYPRAQALRADHRYVGYTFDADGKVTADQKAKPEKQTTFDVVEKAIWNGEEYMLAKDGPLAGHWILRSELKEPAAAQG
ncbi:D-glucuronyl C5-epimerase family protein [Actinoplanes sp. NPDC026623]|uniref:D-glucuronyl C5-epimerase family protein n=1 Tax=Actinoplanes sp. NPDC026623 TaxID=3155610 RepID=UPI0033CCA436